jgi:hypothetical protein
LGYYHAAILALVVVDGCFSQIARLGKMPIAATLFYCGLGLMGLLVASALADKALVRLGIVAKDNSENDATALDVIVERPPIERKSFEDRRAEERDEPSSGYQAQGGELPASLSHGARVSWFIPRSAGAPPSFVANLSTTKSIKGCEGAP